MDQYVTSETQTETASTASEDSARYRRFVDACNRLTDREIDAVMARIHRGQLRRPRLSRSARLGLGSALYAGGTA